MNPNAKALCEVCSAHALSGNGLPSLTLVREVGSASYLL
jgi:hypothetical protein